MTIFSSSKIQALVSKSDVLAMDPELTKILWTASESPDASKISLVDDLRFRIDNHTSPSPVEQDSAAQDFLSKSFPEHAWDAKPNFHRRYALATKSFDPIPVQDGFVLFVRTLFDEQIALVLKPVNLSKGQAFHFALTKVENLTQTSGPVVFKLNNPELLTTVFHVNSSEPIFYNGGDAGWAFKPWSMSFSDGSKLKSVWVVDNPFTRLDLSIDTFVSQFKGMQFDASLGALGSDLEAQVRGLQAFIVSFFHDLFVIGTESNNTNAWVFERAKVEVDLAKVTWEHIKKDESENLGFLDQMHKHLKALQRVCFSMTRSLADKDQHLAYYYAEASEIESGFAVSKPLFQVLSAVFKALVDVPLAEECEAEFTTREALLHRNYLLNKKAHLFWRNLTNLVNLNLEDVIERKWWPNHAKTSSRSDELHSILLANGSLDFSLKASLSSFLAFGAPNPNPRIEFICSFAQDGPTALTVLPVLTLSSSEQSDLKIPAEVEMDGKNQIALAFCPAGSGVFSERGEIGFSPEKTVLSKMETRVIEQVNERHAFSGLSAFIIPSLVKTRTWEAGRMIFETSIEELQRIPAVLSK